MLVSINGGEATYYEGNGFFAPPVVIALVNDAAEAKDYVINLSYPAGTMENPADLVLGENKATVVAGSNGYFYTWIATANGTLTITMSDANWIYAINNLTSYIYGDTQWSDSDPVVNPAVITVVAGDEIQIMVNSYDPTNPYEAPAGTITFTAAFEEEVVEDECAHEWVDATCTAPKTCSKCGETEGEALGHTEVNTPSVNPTCTTPGSSKGTHCSVCGVVIKEPTVKPAIGHLTDTIKGKAATCTEPGLTNGVKCLLCKEILTPQEEIPALGHQFDAETHKCTVCGESDPNATPECAHEWVDATCAAPKTCSKCGATEGEASTTHDYGNRFDKKWGICVVCGYVDDNHEHSIVEGVCEYCDYEFEAFEVPSTFDNDKDGNMDVFYFSAALPEEFTGEDVIWLDAFNGSTGDHMTYDEIGVGSGSLPYPHVYNSDQVLTDSIAFTITVEKAGLYNVAAHYRIKDQKVRGAKFIANEGTENEYAINHTYGWATADEAYEVRNNDFLIGAYMTGIALPLQAGENTITIRVADGVAKSQHFRDLYIVLAEEFIEECETHDYGNRFDKKWGICVVCGYVDDNHEHSIVEGVCKYCDYEFETFEVPSTFDNDKDGNMDVFYFSAALPEEFTGEDVIWLDAFNGSTGDHMTYDEIGVGSGSLPYPHVYNSDQVLTDSIAFTITVEKAGLYNVAAHYRIKDQKVRGAKFIANEGTENEYAINHTYGWATADEAYEVRNNDFLIGAYMTGLVLELQAGENTITIRVADGVAKSQHFRDLYLVPVEA